MNNAFDKPKRYLRDAEICRLLADISPTTLWRLRQRGLVPQPDKIGNINATSEDVVEKIVPGLMAHRAREVD